MWCCQMQKLNVVCIDHSMSSTFLCRYVWATCDVCVWCSQMQKFMSMSRDDMVVNSLSASFDKMQEWPFCVGSPEGIKDQAFLLRQARLVLALAGQLPSFARHSSLPPAAVL